MEGKEVGKEPLNKRDFAMTGLCKQLLVPADCRKNTILSKNIRFVSALRVTERLEIAWKQES